MFEHENVEAEDRTHPLTPGLVLYGHTYLSRVHATVQRMTMFKGIVDGTQFAKGIWAHISVARPYLSAMHDHVQGDC